MAWILLPWLKLNDAGDQLLGMIFDNDQFHINSLITSLLARV